MILYHIFCDMNLSLQELCKYNVGEPAFDSRYVALESNIFMGSATPARENDPTLNSSAAVL